MAYLLDVIALAAFALMVFLGYRRGFIRTVSGVLSFVLALVLSNMLAAPVAEYVYTNSIQPGVVQTLEDNIGKDSPSVERVDEALSDMPAFISGQIAAAGIEDGEDLLNYLGKVPDGETAVGKSVIEINERMKEKVPVFYPSNPFDPDKTHIKVTNPITGKVDSVAVGEWVEVPRAVANILERSAKADKVTMMLQKKGEADFEQKVTEAKE
jgi:hypothetical protein